MTSHPAREKYKEYLFHAEVRQRPTEQRYVFMYALLASIISVGAVAAILFRLF
jgi:hypothetical protein